MTDWFRSWHGAPTDPKWLGIAKRAGVAPGIAVAVAWALMDRASQADDRGSIDGYDADGLACFFGCEPDHIDAVVQAMSDKGMLVDGRFTAWEKRQPKREDDSKGRVTAFRERARNEAKRDVTHGNAPDTEIDTEEKKENIVGSAIADPHPADAGSADVHPEQPKAKAFTYPQEYDDLWNQYRAICDASKAECGSKKNAFERWRKLSAEDRQRCFDGVMQYLLWRDDRSGKPGLFTAHPKHFERFISGRLWETYEAEAA